MEESARITRYCLQCGTENTASDPACRECGRQLRISPLQHRTGMVFFLNELETLRTEGAISHAVYLSLRHRYRKALAVGEHQGSPAVQPPKAPETPLTRPPVPRREGPSWLAEQQANLLLYLGAFLTVIAVLVYVSSSGEAIGGGTRMAVLTVYTLMFMAAGLLCMRLPRVRQAGVVFFAVAALMVPLNFVGAYFFLLSDEDMNPTGLWLAGSLTSALFYAAVSLLRLGGWYPVPTVLAIISALGAVLVLADAPPEAYPGSFIALALLIAVPSIVSLGRVSEDFGRVGFWAAHILVPYAVLAALAMAAVAAGGDLDLTTRWYLPPTVATAALFYWTQALWARRVHTNIEPILTLTALAVTGGAAVTLVYALGVGRQWYGPAIAVVGWLYAGGSEGFGPRWFGQRYLRWMALGAVTASWLFLEALYSGFPREGAGVHFAAAIFYLGAARLVSVDIPVVGKGTSGHQQRGEAEYYRVPAAIAFLYAAGLTLGIGFFHLLSSLPAAETAEASDLGLAYFGLSLLVAAVAATTRWWWPDMRLHVYAIAFGMSLFVVLASADLEGQVTLLLTVYAGVALALALWEREPLGLPLSPAYGFFALLAAWRHYEPNDAVLPLVLSAAAYLLFLFYAGMVLGDRGRRWTDIVRVVAFGYVVLAPVVGWVKLAILADPQGFVDGQGFEETLLYQTSAASVLLVGGLMMAQWWVGRRAEIAVGASAVAMVALLLEIGHFRPENVQAYTAPLGVYVLCGALLTLRVRDVREDMRPLIGSLELIGAALIMAPSFEQSLASEGWRFGLILLLEGLGFVALAVVQRRLWLLGTAVTFVVLDGLHYLFFAGGPPLPNWAILALAGTVVMAAGVAILLGRDRWTHWQSSVQAWWSREPLASEAR